LACRLSEEEDCLVGITCFPGFELKAYTQFGFDGYKRGGYNFDEVCASIREATIQLFKQCESNSSSEDVAPRFTIILHDWGVIPGLMFVNRALEMEYSPHVPNKIVLLDVLTWPADNINDLPLQSEVPYSLRPSIYELSVCFAYRFALATSFLWLRFVSDIIGLINMAILTQLVVSFRLNPVKSFESKYIDERAMQSQSRLAYYRHLVYMCYPYYHMFIALLRRRFDDVHIPRDLKTTPILYIYGTNKNIMFHDWKSLAILEREERENRSECKVVAVEDAGHWMYVQKLDCCLDEIKKFIK
jgi:pimeloyl-ACP methyl ester carboxylesterase